jgi:hypothetical protein
VFVCLCVCVFVCLYVCVCVCVYIPKHMHATAICMPVCASLIYLCVLQGLSCPAHGYPATRYGQRRKREGIGRGGEGGFRSLHCQWRRLRKRGGVRGEGGGLEVAGGTCARFQSLQSRFESSAWNLSSEGRWTEQE